MTYNRDCKDCYNYVDEYGMMLCNAPPDNGKGDAIKRTFLAWYCYQDDRFIAAILNCFTFNADGTVKGIRHPERTDDTLSRDHLIFAYIALLLSGHESLKALVKGSPWQISAKYKQTIDMWLWSRVIIGEWWYRLPYYTVMVPMLLFNAGWNNFVRLMGGATPEAKQSEVDKYTNVKLSDRAHKWKGRRVPMYAIFILVWQLEVLPKGPFKWLLKRIASLMIYRYNYVLKLMLGVGKGVSQADVINYIPMKSTRWSTILNDTNTWDCSFTGDDYNQLDKDLFKRMFITKK
jgi:hypothetical protein